MTNSQIITIIRMLWKEILRHELCDMAAKSSSPIDNIIIEVIDSLLGSDGLEEVM